MPNYNDAQGVADLLSQFDFNIISEGPGDFSTHQPQSGSALIKASPATCSAPPWRRHGPSTRR